MSQIKIQITQDDGQSKNVGYVEEGAFHAKRRRSVHFFRRDKSWALDAGTYEVIRDKHQVATVIIHDVEYKTAYQASILDFEKYGKYQHFKPYGKQIFLEEKYWKAI